MEFKNLTDSDKELIGATHANSSEPWDSRMAKLQSIFGVSERTVRRWIKNLGFSKEDKTGIESSEQLDIAKTKEHTKKKYYLITWAQNNTDVHRKMLTNMESYADFLEAEILVIAGRYRNPTSLSASDTIKHEEETNRIFWDDKIDKYLTANRHNIHKYLQVLADVKTQPTADEPLTGFEGFSGVESSILGHPKQHLKSLPILNGYPHKVIMSTGAITHPNYTDTKAGKKGEFNHIYGFIIVEIRDEEVFHIRNINVDDSGEFNDLFFNVKAGKVTRNKEIEGIVLGDEHSGWEDWDVLTETKRLFEELKPKKVVLHDIFDAYSISHHHESDPFLKYRKSQEDKDVLEYEIDGMMELLEEFNDKDYDTVIVRSNHDDHLDQWLKRQDWKRDCHNALTYMELSTKILKGEAENGVIPALIGERFPNFKCLGINDSYIINGIECGLHGDHGANGSRGSATQFKKLNVRTITGHTHAPFIAGGAYGVGTSTMLRLEYNKGLSSWMNAHVTIDRNGKRQVIMFADGNFTTLYDLL